MGTRWEALGQEKYDLYGVGWYGTDLSDDDEKLETIQERVTHRRRVDSRQALHWHVEDKKHQQLGN